MFIRALNILLAKAKDGRSPIYPGETVEVEDQDGKEFISLKAAVEVAGFATQTAGSTAPAVTPDGNTPEEETAHNGPQTPGNGQGHLDAEQLTMMSFAELKKLAEDMQIDTKGIRSKSAMIEAITAVEIGFDAEEDAPDLSVQDVIE